MALQMVGILVNILQLFRHLLAWFGRVVDGLEHLGNVRVLQHEGVKVEVHWGNFPASQRFQSVGHANCVEVTAELLHLTQRLVVDFISTQWMELEEFSMLSKMMIPSYNLGKFSELNTSTSWASTTYSEDRSTQPF